MAKSNKNNNKEKASKNRGLSKGKIKETNYSQLPDFGFTPPIPEPKCEEQKTQEKERK